VTKHRIIRKVCAILNHNIKVKLGLVCNKYFIKLVPSWVFTALEGTGGKFDLTIGLGNCIGINISRTRPNKWNTTNNTSQETFLFAGGFNTSEIFTVEYVESNNTAI
jgi:hypothetical protein